MNENANGAAPPPPDLSKLTASQRACYAAEASVEWMKEKRTKGRPDLNRKAADQYACDRSSVNRAKAILTRDPVLFARVKSGEFGLFVAYNMLKNDYKSQAERARENIDQIEELARQGCNARQIAVRIGLSVPRVRVVARNNNITLAGDAQRSTLRIDPRRIIGETVNGLVGYATGLRTFHGVSLDDISPEEAGEWVESMTASLSQINALKRKLSDIAYGRSHDDKPAEAAHRENT